MISFKAKHVPTVFEFRKWIAMRLVRLAKAVCPESDDVKAFYMDLYMDYMISGKVITRVNEAETLKEPVNSNL